MLRIRQFCVIATIAAAASCSGGGGSAAPNIALSSPTQQPTSTAAASQSPAATATPTALISTNTVSLPQIADSGGTGDVTIAADGTVYLIDGYRTIVHANKQAVTTLCVGPQNYFPLASFPHSINVAVARDGTVYSAAPRNALAICSSGGVLNSQPYFDVGVQIAIDGTGAAVMVTPSAVVTYTPSGGFKQTPYGGGNAISEVSAPDGSIWFTNGRIIYHIVNGTIVANSNAPSNLVIQDLIYGPDGNLWFCGYLNGIPTNTGNVVIAGSMTQAGVYNVFQLPQNSSSNFTSITAGLRAGTFVLGDYAFNAAVLFTPPSTTLSYKLQLPSGSLLNSIRSYSDGTMWYTTSSPNTLGYFTLP